MDNYVGFFTKYPQCLLVFPLIFQLLYLFPNLRKTKRFFFLVFL
ncbi:hypothetical protein SPAR91_0724 [Streptococcus pneumoniae GA47283]|nr:hypothetical protein SPAR91_0724 [Streptococcus pneumoniae GA47283]